jgi:cobalt-zinc-cadmium efflux system outer membrane protein
MPKLHSSMPPRPLRFSQLLPACLLWFSASMVLASSLAPVSIGYLEAENVALKHNAQIQNARAALDGAQADLITAGARPNAVMSVNASGVDKTQYQYGTRLNALDTIVRIDQPFERGNKRDLRLAKATDLGQATVWDMHDTIRQERFRVASAWLDLRVAEQRYQIAESNMAHADLVLEKARLRFKTGDLSGADLGRIESDHARLQAETQSAQRDRVRASALLANLLGAEMQRERMATRGEWPAVMSHQEAEKLTGSLAERRPDVQAARARLSAAKQAVELARAQRTRDFSVGLQYERNNPTVVNSVGAGIAIPLFTGNDFEGDIRRSMAEMTQAEIAMLQTERTARSESLLYLQELDQANARLRSLQDQALQSAKRTDKAADIAYARGAMSTFEYLEAKRALRLAEIDAVTARADAAKAASAIRILAVVSDTAVASNKPTLYDSPVQSLTPVNMPDKDRQLPDLPGAQP